MIDISFVYSFAVCDLSMSIVKFFYKWLLSIYIESLQAIADGGLTSGVSWKIIDNCHYELLFNTETKKSSIKT